VIYPDELLVRKALDTNVARTVYRTREKATASFYIDQHSIRAPIPIPANLDVAADMDTYPTRNDSAAPRARVPNQSAQTTLTSFIPTSTEASSTPTPKGKGQGKDHGKGKGKGKGKAKSKSNPVIIDNDIGDLSHDSDDPGPTPLKQAIILSKQICSDRPGQSSVSGFKSGSITIAGGTGESRKTNRFVLRVKIYYIVNDVL
jgi:hypothetical protein